MKHSMERLGRAAVRRGSVFSMVAVAAFAIAGGTLRRRSRTAARSAA